MKRILEHWIGFGRGLEKPVEQRYKGGMMDESSPRKVKYHITIEGWVGSERLEESLQTIIINFVDKLANSQRYKNLDIALEDE